MAGKDFPSHCNILVEGEREEKPETSSSDLEGGYFLVVLLWGNPGSTSVPPLTSVQSEENNVH